MDHLLYGPDQDLKTKTFLDIRRRVLLTPEAGKLDFESLDAYKLSAEKLKIALLSLPAMEGRRLVHIYRAEKLDKQNVELLTAFLQQPHDHVVVVLDAEEWDEGTKMRKGLAGFFKKVGSAAAALPNVFDMMRAVEQGKDAAALRLLQSILNEDEQPEKILGGMLWSWSNTIKSRVTHGVYKKGLLLMQEADIALKRGRFPRKDYALEILVVNLSLLNHSEA